MCSSLVRGCKSIVARPELSETDRQCRYEEAIETFFESTTLIFTASEDAYRFFVQNPHPYRSNIHAVEFIFTHFTDHLFLRSINSEHPQLAGTNKLPVSQDIWTPLVVCIRERMPALQQIRIFLSTSSAIEDVEKIFQVLRDWQQQGYGTVEEEDEGLLYIEGQAPCNH